MNPSLSFITPFISWSSIRLVLILALAVPVLARAERDSFFTGTGRDGTLTVSTPNVIVNVYAALSSSANTGDTALTVSSAAGIAAGDLVMLHQSTGLSPEPASGTAGPTNLASSAVGRWELARVASVAGTTLNLTNPLVSAFSSPGTQVIRVPEYSSVTINGSRSITAPNWNGTTGGVLAMLVSGTLANGGVVTVAGRGFRGGLTVNDFSASLGATALDEPAPLGAQKGEGIARTRYGSLQTGRGRVANGAGGGVAYLSGGGGGGNGGTGGQGGNSQLNVDGGRSVGGQGGTALTYETLNRLVFGGGGGAGHVTFGSATAGGNGGGCLFVRAGAITGAGTYLAGGAPSFSGASEGGSGGGGGGVVYLRVAGTADTGAITASGGAGGTTDGLDIGPGGGGGGGRVLFQKGGGAAAPSGTAVNGGAAGTQQNPASPFGSNYGAVSGTAGSVTTLPGAYTQPDLPVLTTPAATATVPPTVSFTGTTSPGATVHVLLDGLEIGTPTADGSGDFTFTPGTPLVTGIHSVVLYAEDAAQASFSAATSPRSFTVGSSDASLSNLVLSAGTLSPVFDSATTAYSATVLRPTSSITVTPTATDSNASLQVRINGGTYAGVASGDASGSLALNLGGNSIDVLVTAQDGTTTKTYTITLTRWTYLEGWRNQYFSTIANSGTAADNATPQHDGIENLMKFALGMSPEAPGVSPANIVKNGGTLEFTYPRSIEASAECTFIVEWSDTLLPGSWSSAGVSEAVINTTSTVEQIQASFPAGSNDRRFARLRVTRP